MTHAGGTGEEEKIILNGGTTSEILRGVAGILDKTCTSIYNKVRVDPHPFPEPGKLVKLANELENDALALQAKSFKFQREFLEQVGFQGPWPNSMK